MVRRSGNLTSASGSIEIGKSVAAITTPGFVDGILLSDPGRHKIKLLAEQATRRGLDMDPLQGEFTEPRRLGRGGV